MWQNTIYKPKVNEGYVPAMQVKEIFRRDNYQCQSCRKRLKLSELSCHHILSRGEGGDNHPSNLITLCKPCHNLIELNEIKALADILYYKKKVDAQIDSEIDSQTIAEDVRANSNKEPDWRTWVYGGQKRHRKTIEN